jgi:hypothetical protein
VRRGCCWSLSLPSGRMSGHGRHGHHATTRAGTKLKRWARGTSALCLGVWTGCMDWQTAASAKNDCILSVSALWLPSLLFRLVVLVPGFCGDACLDRRGSTFLGVYV